MIFQLNDTHPVIAVPELMRILVDEKGFEWDEAWAITQKCFAYTCHTLLPEALEVWPVELLGRLLPRHLEIIYRINDEFLDAVREAYPGDEARLRRMSIVSERAVRMAYLATVAGSKVNGVAELHSQLLRDKVLPDFSDYWPDKFTNVTNGVTPRRFVRLANKNLSALITEAIGPGWITDLDRLSELEPFADDAAFRERSDGQEDVQDKPGQHLLARNDVVLPTDAMIDVMVKRLHEYKRQTLKVLHIVTLYQQIRSGEVSADDVTPRVFVFGAKAAPGYRMAKQIIGLINAVGETVNNDPLVKGKLTVVFPPNYNVTLAEKLIPAADLSEQISLAGKEASGTGNMKLALNGALTIGTDDGANVEIRELVGDENFFLFGLLEPEVEALSRRATPRPASTRRPAAARGHRPHRVGRVLRRRPDGVRAGGVQPARRRPVPRARRLPVLHRHPGPGRQGLRRPGRVVAFGDPQRGSVRLLLQRPGDARVHRPDLAHPARPRRLDRFAWSEVAAMPSTSLHASTLAGRRHDRPSVRAGVDHRHGHRRPPRVFDSAIATPPSRGEHSPGGGLSDSYADRPGPTAFRRNGPTLVGATVRR